MEKKPTEREVAQIKAKAENLKKAVAEFTQAANSIWAAQIDMAIASDNVDFLAGFLEKGLRPPLGYQDTNCMCNPAPTKPPRFE